MQSQEWPIVTAVSIYLHKSLLCGFNCHCQLFIYFFADSDFSFFCEAQPQSITFENHTSWYTFTNHLCKLQGPQNIDGSWPRNLALLSLFFIISSTLPINHSSRIHNNLDGFEKSCKSVCVSSVSM